MNLRKEQLVFVIALVGVAALELPLLMGGAKPARPTRAGAGSLTLERHDATPSEHALTQVRTLAPMERDLFASPRDTRPLPPLDIEPLPELQFSALRPPPEPAPGARVFGRLLRTSPTLRSAPGLFASELDAGDVLDLESDIGSSLTAAANAATPSNLTPEERSAQLASWKKLYDWVRISEGQPLFGYIRNEDRFGLRQDLAAAVLFVEIDPVTGKERLPGQKPVAFARERVLEFALADTFENEIQQRRRVFGKKITSGQYGDVLSFAGECVRRRHEARSALVLAEELYHLAESAAANDPQPRLGLARCYEAGFDFERALEVYQGLLDGGFAHRGEVHARIGELEARFRLFSSADARFAEADRLGRTQWDVQWSFGRYLLERGDVARALEHLRAAFKHEPPSEQRDARSEIRFDLARALVAAGAVSEARSTFEKALQSDSTHAGARAGLRACELLGEKATGSAASSGDQKVFAEQINDALLALAADRFTDARDGLMLAAQADPLRAHRAWRALSWLAEITGHTEEAWRWIELALRADPTDAWTLYQRGRLAWARDDQDGARESWTRALDQELDFVDALVGLGRLAFERGEHAAADKYLERALSLDPNRAEVHSMRGWNAVWANDQRLAGECFASATRWSADDPTARAGLAWLAYLKGEVESSMQLFAELDDLRRTFDEKDGFRLYAERQLERIKDHEAKVVWSDRFERRALRNEWYAEEAVGPTVTLTDGQLVLAGNFNQAGDVRAWRKWAPTVFYAVECSVTIERTTKAKVGVFLSKERDVRGGGTQVLAKVGVARHPDGPLQILTMDKAEKEETWVDVPAVGGVEWWPTERPVRLRIERVGEGTDATGRIVIDGVPVLEGFRMASLASVSQELRVGVFASGATGRPVRVRVDDVEVVYRVQK